MGQHDLDAEICSSPLISSRVSVQAPFRNPLAVDFQQMVVVLIVVVVEDEVT